MRKAGKKPMVGGILALSLILTGTGYAYWTDTLNVTTKATTGDLEVTFADLGLYAQYANETRPNGWSIVDGIGETSYVADDFFMRDKTDYNSIAKDGSIDAYREQAKNYNNVDFDAKLVDATAIKKDVGEYTTATTNGSDQIEVTVNKMYPGYAQAFRTDILNVGEIAAKLSNVRFSVGSDEPSLTEEAKQMLGVAVFMNQEQYHPDQGQSGENVFKLASAMNLDEDAYFKVGGVEFVRLSALEKADPDALRSTIEHAEILCSPATDNRMDLFLGVAMDPDADGHYTTGSTQLMNIQNEDANSQNKSVIITMDLDWDQFNVGKDTENANILVEQNR